MSTWRKIYGLVLIWLFSLPFLAAIAFVVGIFGGDGFAVFGFAALGTAIFYPLFYNWK